MTRCPSPCMQLQFELAGLGFSFPRIPNSEHDLFGRRVLSGTAAASSDTARISDEDPSLIGGDGEELYPEASYSGTGMQRSANRSDAVAAENSRHSSRSRPVASAPTAFPFVPQRTHGAVTTVAGSSDRGIGAEERPLIPSYERRRLQRMQRWTGAEEGSRAGI